MNGLALVTAIALGLALLVELARFVRQELRRRRPYDWRKDGAL